MLTYETPRTTPIYDFYRYGAGDRDLKLSVLGNPFAMPQDAFALAVEEEFPGNGALQPATRPRLSPDASAKNGFQLALAFGGDLDETGAQACAGQGGSQGPAAGGRVVVVAAFCVNNRVLSEASGQVAANDPRAPEFRELLGQLSTSLFRPDEPMGPGGGEAPLR
jgi:hypothetical protein